jgi:hypothetical protein
MATLLINKLAVRKYLLAMSEEYRGGKFTRVSDSTFSVIDSKLRMMLESDIKVHPSIGKTVMIES